MILGAALTNNYIARYRFLSAENFNAEAFAV
jgi:hypothetical protein